MTFSGFPPSALRLYEDLAADNSKEAWRLRHRERYERDVRAPMDELAAELGTFFEEWAGPGAVQVLGPVRDTRMSHDKSPYKTYQGAYLDLLPCLGLWVHLDRDGLYASGRWYPYAGAEVARYRAAVEEEDGGAELAAITGRLAEQGFVLGGDRLKSRPRGCPRTTRGWTCCATARSTRGAASVRPRVCTRRAPGNSYGRPGCW